MDIAESFKMLNVAPDADRAKISMAYKKLAMQYHPDRNRERIAWANEAMTRLNIAYSNVMTHRFSEAPYLDGTEQDNEENAFGDLRDRGEPHRTAQQQNKILKGRDELIDRFARVKNSANNSLYKYFQYNLYNFARRDTPVNTGIFNNVVKTLRRSYHACNNLAALTDDSELKNHFTIFSAMLFHFYRASECINIIDSYKNQYDVDAYREYKRGDENLHIAHKEIFYDRHNRGFFKGSAAIIEIQKAEAVFAKVLKFYPDSNWAVETRIKYDYISSLKDYINLFFTE